MSDVRLSMSGKPMPPDDVQACFICGEAFEEGQMVILDVSEGCCHRSCCGDDRDGYVSLDTEAPIGLDGPIPEGEPYRAEEWR